MAGIRPRLRRFGGPMRSEAMPIHCAEAGPTAAAQVAPAAPLASLLAAHVLRDGEIVLLILKPSIWFIFLNSAAFAGAVLLATLATAVMERHLHDRFWFEVASFFIAGRLMWSTLQWMGRLYVLTDLRVLRLSGVFSINVFDCPLRKVVRTRNVSLTRERLVCVGSIEIIPQDETMPTALWQTIAHPKEVHERLIAAINRARQTGTGGE